MCYWCKSERRERRASFLGAARGRLKLARAESRPAFREALLGAARTFRDHAHANEAVAGLDHHYGDLYVDDTGAEVYVDPVIIEPAFVPQVKS